ncbi:MAG: DUF4912 domain-containing protein, partial [Firmicutes bacterium]|nr:DUF4912 domain-containing protein [Bacillota bacterium]
MQLLALLAAALIVLALVMLAERSGMLGGRRSCERRPGRPVPPLTERQAEFSEEIAPTRPVAEPEYAIPSRYGDNTMVLMVRDPEWLYAYWEIQPEELRRAAEMEGLDLSDSVPVMRLYDVTDGRKVHCRDIILNEYSDSWYLSSMVPARTYYAELGRLTKTGRFVRLAASNTVSTPPAEVSPVVSPEWPPLAQPAGPWAAPGSPEFAESMGKAR